jgi:hypothetical protein
MADTAGCLEELYHGNWFIAGIGYCIDWRVPGVKRPGREADPEVRNGCSTSSWRGA